MSKSKYGTTCKQRSLTFSFYLYDFTVLTNESLVAKLLQKNLATAATYFSINSGMISHAGLDNK
jgi:hypothetical protein